MENENYSYEDENESGLNTQEEEYYFSLDRADDPYEREISWEDRASDDAGVSRFGEI